MARTATFGKYTAVEGKLSHDDARAAYVTGPIHGQKGGRIAPLASFWNYEEAVSWAKDHDAAMEGCQL
jgi:hypothetical protein